MLIVDFFEVASALHLSEHFTSAHPNQGNEFRTMKTPLIALGVVLTLATGCATSTVRSTQLAQGAALLAIEPVKARVVVDTSITLQAVSQTRTVLGLFRSGDREFAEYPGMIFQRG
ncbi:MAG: hypothetical protein L7U25_06000, partial [Candidatus Poseidonia sp.]|nr:hypothetical protein [Poseidonia sp.]